MRALIPALLILASCASPAPPPPEPKASDFDTPISLELDKATLQEAMDQLARRGKLNVIMCRYDGNGRVTLSVKDRPVGEVIDSVAKTFGLVAERRDTHNIVKLTNPVADR